MTSTETPPAIELGAAPADADPPAARPGRGTRAIRFGLRWLPGLILLLVFAGAVATVADIEPPPIGASASPTRAEVLATPVLSVRRLPALLPDLVDQQRLGSLSDELTAVMAASPPASCLSVRLDGEEVYAQRSTMPLTPASTQKILTATAALTVLGPDHRFTTDLRAASQPGDGVIDGDLFFVGGGDPTLMTADYLMRYRTPPAAVTSMESLADALIAAGVTQIRGRLVGDDTRYDGVRYNPAWPARFVGQNQTGPLSALSVNDGFTRFASAGAGAGGSASAPAARPAQHAAQVLTDLLRARGVVVAADADAGNTPTDATPLVQVRSAPLDLILGDVLGRSDNDAAELLVKEMGLVQRGAGTFEAGSAVVADMVVGAGIDADGLQVFGGSGLAEAGTLTCGQLTALLSVADLSSYMAVAGESGTLERRWVGTPLQGRVRAKTGTLNQVSSLAGYADTLTGSRVTFSFIANVEAPARIQAEVLTVQQQIAEILVDWKGLVDLDELLPIEAAR